MITVLKGGNMGLFQKIFNKADDNGQVQRNTDDLKMLYLSNDPQTLARLRHAIWGDWYYSYRIKIKENSWQGEFRPSRFNDDAYHTTLRECDCEDQTEDGKPIKPCCHMYRLALEVGLFETYMNDLKVKAIVKGMRGPLFNVFSDIVCGGYYELVKEWKKSKKTHDELVQIGLIKDVDGGWQFTDYFLEHAAAFNYYTCLENRSGNFIEGVFDPSSKQFDFAPAR